MAASDNLQYSSAIPQISRHGVLTLYGFGISVTMQSGHLEIDGGIGPERRKIRLPRVGHGLRRLVCISEDGFVTLSALKWLADQDAAFVMLDRMGKVLFVTGPTASSDVRLRKAQALAHSSGSALEIARELIRAKLQGQESLARTKFNAQLTANSISQLRERLSTSENIDSVRHLEAQGASYYWSAWRTQSVMFPRKDANRVPEHWRTFGTRKSPLTGSPRLAVNPPGAILNYCYALLESESRLAIAALGLDPGFGMLHVDTPNRDSLACDIMEAVRPSVDAWLLNWLAREPMRRSDFFEERNGNCRLMGPFAAKLSGTAPTWGKLVAPWAEYVAHTLWSKSSLKSERISTRLTQQHRREAKGKQPLPRVETPKLERICRICGKQIGHDKTYCLKCAPTITRENFDSGRKEAQRPEFLLKRAETMLHHRREIRKWKTSDTPAWLTREVYLELVVPKLAGVTKGRIRSALRVSEPYASFIKDATRVPHPRHWATLAQLTGVARSD